MQFICHDPHQVLTGGDAIREVFQNAVQTDSVSDAEYMEKWNNNSASNIKRRKNNEAAIL